MIVVATTLILRIIPANTGRIGRCGSGRGCGWDHPREYGENPPSKSVDSGGAGSSPRIRGECDTNTIGHCLKGIIPANTGRILP